MYFKTFEDFIAMGGHGFYVWLCYGVTLSALIAYFVVSNKQTNSAKVKLKKFYVRLDASKSSSSEK